ncbi:MAG: N-acetyl sugar amidotransferase [Candidatus Wildermuthbacteria bacterium]|nr:N-acetyl sugar amidotransferase [Candidatus Wildermuthbacteria bacterium]
MTYCKRCCYPANTRTSIIFDEQGVCSGCRLIESRPKIDWKERSGWLKNILEEYRAKARAKNNPYDCIIPVSGGKDSHFQTYLIKKVYGLNPLLVTYNHLFNTKRGIRNLTNLVKQFDCDLIRFTSNPESVRRISRYMLKKVGDITWHYHAGIMTFPIQIAVQKDIPLIVWGEHGFAELTGMFNQDDMVEFSKKGRQEHSMRGFEPEDLVADPQSGITQQDLAPFFYPSDEDIERVGVRGIYLSNYMQWDVRAQTKLMIEQYGFETAVQRERTFHLYDKLDDIHANGAHDYLKYLKFGYGRATDDASNEIRHGRMTREEGIEMVKKYDHVRPSDLDLYLAFMGITEKEFEEAVGHLRDPEVWEKRNGAWAAKDSIANHANDAGVDQVRLPLVQDRAPLPPSKQPYYSRDDHIAEDTEYIYL